ncbi:hypothetical protein HID58_085870 [Brassica napus]|uniref:BnaC09g14170D protein n=3 Tax=Brassica TaxID=3705 RepID=A0A078IA22_BRANA|nr:uncharacterized protein BNAC09G14170D isoform X2 [Brassica napus]KAH0857609.1 hypothetical protein HID58_085870 [Brassica napus]CDY46987.1 BnaC09g14170D [Brassica napus]VDD29744.1 unnamed protein product [Brassica oleracea]
MIPMDNYRVPSTSTTGLVYRANSSMTASSGFHFTVTSPSGLKHEPSLAVEWSVEEQYILDKGLAKFKDEPQVTKYVKIASTLPDKSVRDVAMRCKWMTQKRRKGEEHSASTKVSYRKVVDLPPKLNMLSTMPHQNSTYVMNHMCQSARIPFEGSSDAVMELLRQNAHAFSQISSNLSVSKPQDNISLFHLARNNISSILNDMKEMPGIISRMPPLPVSINNDLASRLMTTSTRQPRSYIIPSSIHLKQEP